ncbi:amidohydrolase [Desulfolutivibrio sulfoxidireducens]|uniref:amidohydrolase n=1 Tax=Desulfolutivibrio sulfoxidireducens TaxID=2773299 RepID=UPI00159E1E2C|nr:amidohydrolase [Desulfolutivibrio sulfoxidireducens]QLA19119.1 amidohydrolase family protein [Desulfolutivibrio sulfoxidireducens]
MPTSCDLLLCASCVVTQNTSRETIENGAVAVTGGRIAAVGPRPALAAAYAPAETLDLGRAMLLPGLINAHTHAAMTLFRGLADDLPITTWLTEHIWPMEKRLTPGAIRLGALAACAEMLASGTTCFADLYFFAAETARAASETGMRAVVGEGVLDFPTPSARTPAEALDLTRDLFDSLRGHPRIRPMVAAHSPYAASAETLRACAAFARNQDAILNLHAAEGTTENADSLKNTGKRVIPHLHSLGVLGENCLLAHCVHTDAADHAILAQTGTKVAHCPKSNAKLSSGAAPVPAMLTAGVTVGLGTDGAASNNALNLFSEMGFASLTHKLVTGDPTAFPAQAALDAATLGGAACLGIPDIGAIAPGRHADLAALSLDRPNMTPLHNAPSQAVYAASGAEVVLTMVAGRVVYRDGRFPDLDYPALAAEVRDMARHLAGHRP